jgi:CARDB
VTRGIRRSPLEADFSFTVLVRNVGDASVPAPDPSEWTSKYVLSSDPDIDANDLIVGGFGSGPTLAPHDEFAFFDHAVLPTDLEPGVYYLGVIVDNSDFVPERNELNNTRLYCRPLFVE